jgi:hypothetical protein
MRKSAYLLALLEIGGALGAGLLLALTLLEKGLREQDLVLSRDSAKVQIRLVRSPHTAVWEQAPMRELLQCDILRFG